MVTHLEGQFYTQKRALVMAKRKITATQRLRANVRRQISRMEQRGYFVPTEIKEKVKSAKYQTLKSFQNNKYSKLYSESTGLSDRGKIISGTEYRQQERKESARKAAITRRERKSVRERQYHSQEYYDELEQKKQEYYDELERQRREQDDEDYEWEKQRRQQDYLDYLNSEAYREGEIKYNEIIKLIDQYPTKGAERLKEALKNEITNYGKNNVITAIGMAPDYYAEHARNIIYYEEDSTAIHSAFLDFFELITGTIPTDTEAKELGDTLDEMTDYESR